MDGIKPFVVEVAAIQQIERSWLDNKIVQHVDLVGLAVVAGDYRSRRLACLVFGARGSRVICSCTT